MNNDVVPESQENAAKDNNKNVCHDNSVRYTVIAFLIIMGSAGIVLAVFIPLNWNMDPCTDNSNIGRQTETSGVYKYAAVSADSSICSSMGTRVLVNGGNAVDAAIVTVLCSGSQNMHSCGIGGGSFWMINDEKNDIRTFINCREKAPQNADRDMYVNGTNSSLLGGISIAVPGELACLATAHDLYGRLPWKDLIDMIVDLIENKVFISTNQAPGIADHAPIVVNNEIFYNPDGQVKQAGDKFVNQNLAETFKTYIANDKWAWRGELAAEIVADVSEEGGIITVEDIKEYEAYQEKPLFIDVGQYRIYIPPPPASGVVFAFIFNIMANYHERGQLNVNDTDDFYHKLIEAYKFAYGKRSMLGDPYFQNDTVAFDELVSNLTSYDYAATFLDKITDVTHPFEYYEADFDLVEDEGTSHMNILDKDGMAVGITSTINGPGLGSKIVGRRTGIIFNNEMDDFSTPGLNNAYGVPPSPANFIAPGKQPLSSMTPIIAVDRETNKVKFMAGASGGTRITTSVALVAIRSLLLDEDANEVVQSPRVHHQLIPDAVRNEPRFDLTVIESLKAKGHDFEEISLKAIVQVIKEKDGLLTAVSDIRKGGKPDGY